MGAVWETRIVQSEDGTLRFAECRFRVDDSTSIAGITMPIIKGKTIEDMRQIAQSLLRACDRAIIDPDGEDPERQEEDENDWDAARSAASYQDWLDEQEPQR